MRHAALLAVTLSALAAVACGSSSSDAEDRGPGGGIPGSGGGGGSGGVPVESLNEFGYASESEAGLGTQASAAAAPVNTICGSLDTTSIEKVEVFPIPAQSRASATRSREMLMRKQAPISVSLRTEDHLSYYRIGAGVAPADALVPTVILRPLQIGGTVVPLRYQLFVGLEAGPISARPPVALTVLVDTTPSMAGEPLERAKKSLRALADALAPNDHLVVMTTQHELLFDQALVDPLANTKDLELQLAIGADTTLRVPVQTALEKASSLLGTEQWNRVVLISDGQGDPDMLPLDDIAAATSAGIRLGSVGVGGSYVIGDALLYRAAQAGRGSYVYIDSPSEAEAMLKARFDEVFGVLYDAVQVTLDLPWFLKLLDDGSTAGPPQGDADPRAMAPGATLSFLFQVQSCADQAMTKYGTSYPLSVTTSWVKPSDQSIGSVTEVSKAADFLNMQSTALEEYLAAQAYVAALRAPTKARFADAFELLNPLRQPDNAFDEMWNLLDAYPTKP
ncbi:MAG: hypothetical protein HS104_38295 [Polyangiaceae bacterium]|nr:hypothetical protein [Polyangiaceae bacterium]MCE7890155.1 hypothetical protein [Sorangiineae bacterium PRO1]MCL4749814.1 hypothetical protein [Myxococcales bacterium]